MARPVKKAVFPVAGLGTRSLPATKSIPKEMLTVVDKPVIQYAVEEAREAGIEEFIFVTSRGKTAMEDHFDQHPELYATLERRGKEKELAASKGAELAVSQLTTVRQPEPLGLGHAVWCARHIVGDEPFAVLLPDEVFKAEPSLLAQMVQAYGKVGGNLIAVREVEPALTARYGILDVDSDDGTLASVKGLVEKPKPEVAPSNLSIVGRYILQPEVFAILDRKETGAGDEIQLTDAMAKLIGRQPFHGMRFSGDRYDCGDKAGFVAANVAFALDRDDLAGKVREALSGLI
ncbi:UTP--glucose-1-phosphate uridylyltransferase GalU [Inquilinus sp. CAU 1745]|uniref:UTP--glucose-1-phosphate uridylyltransferase GalU n=1 Tax=Inquilinus sp. CAU 1745 TaxID=3140369 RepID=UPI00325BDA5F